MIKVLKQALDALKAHADIGIKSDKAIASLRQAIKELESQEPVAVRLSNGVIDCLGTAIVPIGALLYAHPPQSTEQEPVAIVREQFVRIGNKDNFQRRLRIAGLEGNHLTMSSLKVNDKLYAHPSQRTWVGLTNEERARIWANSNPTAFEVYSFAKAIEVKLKEKNR